MTSDIVIKNATKSISVTIYSSKVEEDYAKDIPKVTIPKSNTSSSIQTYLIDLRKITHTFTITGFIVETTSKTADTQVANLRDIIENNTSIYMTYTGGGGSSTPGSFNSTSGDWLGNILKAKITEQAMDEPDTLPAGIVKYAVMIQFIEGDDRRGGNQTR